VRRVHHEVVTGLMADPNDPEMQRRCEAAGVPLERRQLVGLCVRLAVTPGEVLQATDDLVATVVRSASEVRAPALVCELDTDVRVLLSLPLTAYPDRVVDELAAQVARRHRVLLGAGREVRRVADVDRTLRESHQVARALRADDAGRVHRLRDVHIRGLLGLLEDDDRLRLFAERELAPLREYDATHGTHLLDAVRALLQHPEGKAAAAASLHISRPVLYDRLNLAGRVTGTDLSDPDTRVSLHVALLAEGLM
jgi:purine catabolism regulator